MPKRSRYLKPVRGIFKDHLEEINTAADEPEFEIDAHTHGKRAELLKTRARINVLFVKGLTEIRIY